MVGRVIQDTLNQYLRNMIMNIMHGNENKTPLMSKRVDWISKMILIHIP